MRDSHQHCSRRTLATHISNAEEQLLLPHEIVVQVSSHFARRLQVSFHLYPFIFHLSLRQHGVLYLARHAQLGIDARFLGADAL